MHAVAAHAELHLIVASMYSPGLAPSEQLTSRAVAQCTSEEVTAAMVHCFQGYLVPMRLTPERYEARSRAENLDPFASRLYYSKGASAAVAMIARLETRFADRPLAIQALVPENMAPGLFRKAGWERQKLSQFEMKIEF